MVFLRGTLAFVVTTLAALTGLAILALAVIAVIFATNDTDTSGEVRIATLEADVSIIRDEYGVPHIFAGSRPDAYRALGFVHAQDRFFQMEFARRTAFGRLAEVIGPPGLRSDRFMRTLSIGRLAEDSVAAMSPEARGAVDAYTEGVNAWIGSEDRVRPAEMIALGIEPEPWRAADSAAWVRLMALLLAGDWRAELARAQLDGVLTPQQMRDLWPDEPESAPTTVVSTNLSRKNWAALAQSIPDIFPEASASNEWAVSGARSETGFPLLANDPHLGLTAPGMWHLSRIVTPDFEASGGALPGQPFYMVGQNGHVAWGLTTTHSDTQDLFIERLDPADPQRYLTPHGSLPFETTHEEIGVRLGETETIAVRRTRHGPVISDLSPDAAALAGEGHVVALAFAALHPDDRTAGAVHAMNSARSAGEFRTALRDFHAPMQNVIYADKVGTIGVVAAGRLPIRPGGPGLVPAPGWTGDHDWAGFVPFEELPQTEDPADGMIVNANNRVAPRSYPHVIANDWPAGFRAERITELLTNRARHSAESFGEIQTDVLSRGAILLSDTMLAAYGERTDHSEAIALLRKWDGTMDRNRPEPLIYAAWAGALESRLIDDELGAARGIVRGAGTRAMIGMLRERQTWCDDTGTEAPESCSDTLAAALEDALEILAEEYGSDMSAWKWGDAHRVTFVNPLLRNLPALAGILADPLATPGGDHTINRGSYRGARGPGFAHVHGSGLRAIFDMSAPADALYMIAPGQSERLASEHYSDLALPWRDGRYIVLKGGPETLRRSATSELTLSP